MNSFIFHFATGNSLYTGIFLLLLAVLIACLRRPRWWRWAAHLLAIIGVLFIWLSASPTPRLLYWLLLLTLAAWLLFDRRSRRFGFPLRLCLVAVPLAMCLLEYPHRFMPPLPSRQHRHIYVLGDSITAGYDHTDPWPVLLQRRSGVATTSLARVGSTLTDGLQQADRIPPGDALVIVELGGIDMLDFVPAATFAADYERLLQRLSADGRTLVLIELPLAPLYEEYGRIQRRLALRYGAVLVPKRYFAAVLCTRDPGSDGLHISTLGATHMADTMRDLLAPLLVASTQPAR